MKTELIEILGKTHIGKEVENKTEIIGCCGGVPVNNEEACCKLDEDKKAEGDGGCGCNTTTNKNSGSGCC